ncbi:MAG: hypothetical protein AWU57_207 [Marinobacter sp. T13-3]|nr:MAG: hypothetical protein AWU57_207 [Marinobacter sp. T13-3]
MEQTSLDLSQAMKKVAQPQKPYRLGVDVGVASIGAAAVTDTEILGIHVRTFEKGEINGKSGRKPLNADYRRQKGQRKRLRRKKNRLLSLRRLFRRVGMIESAAIEAFPISSTSPWQLRTEGLDRRLTNEEWAQVLYHIAKHRGFQSNRRVDMDEATKLSDAAGDSPETTTNTESDSDTKKMLAGVADNKRLLAEKGYRTIGEAVARDPKFSHRIRNKEESYSHTIGRDEINAELNCLFQAQNHYGNPHATEELSEQIIDLINWRRKTVTGDDIKRMVGRCTLEPKEYRAAIHSVSAEEFRWLSTLSRLRIVTQGESRPLTKCEWDKVVDLPWRQEAITYTSIRNAIGLRHDIRSRFNIRYETGGKKTKTDTKNETTKGQSADAVTSEVKTAEKETAFKAKGYHILRKAYKAFGYDEQWDRDRFNTELLDTLATAVTFYKDDSEIQAHLETNDTPEYAIQIALRLPTLTKFSKLSNKAILKILPHMRERQSYSNACLLAGYKNHHKQYDDTPQNGKIPRSAIEHIKNTVVYRSLNQARRVINAMVKEYGAPQEVHIELARDMEKSAKKKDEIDLWMKKRKKKNDELRERFGKNLSRDELLKYKLYEEQNGQCAYSLQPIQLGRLLEPNYVEVDHALPRSRSMDNSYNNKVLVLTKQNRDKGDRTPFEYFGEDQESVDWKRFTNWVESNPQMPQAKRRKLLTKSLQKGILDNFSARNLSDTRYIARELKTLIEHYILNTPEREKTKYERCVVISGKLTAQMRQLWGISKARDVSDRHHGSDAAVIACITPSMVRRITRYLQLQERRAMPSAPGKGDEHPAVVARAIPHAPVPWPTFEHDLEAALEKVLVSRPQSRKWSGPIHADTIYGEHKDQETNTVAPTQRIKLTQLTKSNYKNIVGYDEERNKDFIDQIEERLECHNFNGKQAFGTSQSPIYRIKKNGELGPEVKKVTIKLPIKNSVFRIRRGYVKNAKNSTIYINIYQNTKTGKFEMHPVYAKDLTSSANASKSFEYSPDLQLVDTIRRGDYIEITRRNGEVISGYYATHNISTSVLELQPHDTTDSRNNRTPAIKTSLNIERFHIDILGRKRRVVRRAKNGLADDRDK